MTNVEIASWEHPYLKNMYPSYDYRNPEEAWSLHCANSEGIRNCSWQIKAFHYWWVVEQCQKTGEIGLTINMEDSPFCISVSQNKGSGHIWSHYNSIHKVLEPNKFPLIIASAAIPAIECGAGKSIGHRCSGIEILTHVYNWMSLLKRGGVLIAAILDNTGPLSEGRSLLEHASYNHAWTAKQFEKLVLAEIYASREDIQVEEFDTLKNGMAFNLVLRKVA